MPEPDRDDYQVFIADLGDHPPVAHPVAPVPGAVRSQTPAPLTWVVKSASCALASQHRFEAIHVATDGLIVVHTDQPGYRDSARFAGEASRLVGAYVQVITDDVPAASVPTTSL